jgi:hypothetical protein
MSVLQACQRHVATYMPKLRRSHLIVMFPITDLRTIFLGAFAKLRKATVGFVVPARPCGTTRLVLD